MSCTVEELPHHELGAITRATATAVIPNPWLGTGTSQDLSKRTEAIAPLLAKLLSDRLLHALGGAEKVEAFGKAALVGSDGELEHAGALIHTPFFGNLLREALGGTSIICFVDGRGVPGESLRVPMWHKTAAATRTHYQTLELSLPDAPHAGEIAVIAAASTGPRPHARIGDRTTDQVITSEILKGIQL
ncbi:peptide synthetase [Arthrobacter sp. W1]|nr:peptide synthetase [Arthrobacter sp. W1]